ncbi:hypothetical protein BJY04DRAFT_54567 [Aspergillus karnatakaensis]|uniref:Zn(II)2Cys6 transcription factor domain-containing protein n=1 Tax=Aspergillus karnatakaensis TaxID=1810916 RepID=UPI003CCCA6AD
MVGVPRSSSCRECLHRRVKCDRTRPECQRCQARGMRCPGYRRALKFYNQTTDGDFTDARQFEEAKAESATSISDTRSTPNATSPSTSSTTTSTPASSSTYTFLAQLRRPSLSSIDETLAPALVRKALDTQAKEVFEYVVLTTFPLAFCHFAPRLEPNWVNFIRYHENANTIPVMKATHALDLWYLGVKNKDPVIVDYSRFVYGEALRHLAGLVANPRTRLSDVTLATAVLLSVFEMLDPITPHSWLIHARGMSTLVQERGPRIHSSGFARTAFITLRSFLIADAFVRQEPSFLEQPEWKATNREAIAVEDRLGRSNWMGRYVEEIFNEISLGPGFLSQTTALISNGFVHGLTRDDLMSRIKQSRSILRNFQRQITSASASEARMKELEKFNDPKGPYSMDDIRAVVARCLQGITSGLALLDQLLVLLEADKKRASEHGRISEDTWGSGQPSVPQASLMGPFSKEDRPLDWLDQMMMTMGTLAISNT